MPRSTAVVFVTFATFTDIVAYSVAVPVLPDLSRKLGASPAMIGLLFASFGITLLIFSMPMGAFSDRIGRRAPLAGGLLALAASTALFAFGNTLPWLFMARLVQGAADAVTWVVGFALIADLFGPAERGRVTGIIMSGASVAFMVGPSLGGWLYKIGGMRLPFLAVAALALAGAIACMWLRFPSERADREHVPIAALVRVPAIAVCTAVVVATSATISMLEPILAMYLETTLEMRAARVGAIFGIAAVATAALHPIFGRMADRFGARQLTLTGLVLTAGSLILLGQTWSFQSAALFYAIQAAALALVITPSLAYMAEVTSEAGIGSFGVAYGLYNMAWGMGLLSGPALGGFLFQRLGFHTMAVVWTPLLIVVAWLLARVQDRGSMTGVCMFRRSTVLAGLVAGCVALSSYSLRADVREDEKTHVELAGALGKIVNIFGGKAAREGVTSTVAVKGDRKIRFNDSTGQIIDLSEEKVYELDMKKKTYKVTTFAELRRQMEEAQQRAAQQAPQAPAAEKQAPPPSDTKPVEVEFDVDVKNTGQTKTINGFETHETVVTIAVHEKGKTLEQSGGMVLTSDMWMVPRIAAMKEVAEFEMRYAQKMYGPMITGVSPQQMASAMAMYPMIKPAMGRMSTEGAKLDGTAIITTMTMDGVKSEEQMAQEAQQQQQASQNSDSQSSTPPTNVSSLFGKFAKNVAAKKMNKDKDDDQPKSRATFLTSTNEVLKVATDVSAAEVGVPAGFKEAK